MIEIIRQVLPYLLLLFFVIKSIKEPLFFLGVPFLMLMDGSIFFDNIGFFNFPGRVAAALPFMWFMIIWIIAIVIEFYRTKDEFDKTQSLNEMDFCIIGLIIITLLGFGLTIKNYSTLNDVFKEFLNLISLFVCYFIIKAWTANNKPEIIRNFLFSLVVINSIASLFYIIHQGLHVKIYQETENFIVYLQGKELTRTFWFMPQLMFFSIAFLLVFKEKKVLNLILLIINLLAVFISYTRSFVIGAVIIFLFYSLFFGLKNKSLAMIFKNIAIYGLLGITGLIVISKVLPTNTKYLFNRFSEITTSSTFRESNTLQYRFLMTGKTIERIDKNKKIVGMGSVTEKQVPWVIQMKQTTSDMVWAGVTFRWGIAGVILFITLYIFSIIRAYSFYLKSDGVLSDLVLVFLLYIISQIIESFTSWTFMSGHGFAIGLWYLAMLSALTVFDKNKTLVNSKILSNE